MKRRLAIVLLLASVLLLSTGWTAVMDTNVNISGDSEADTYYIDVNVATVWSKPNITREVDEPSTTNPADPRKWTSSMSYQDKIGLVGKLETQALYGSQVTVLERQGDWVKVAVHNQFTPRNSAGYPGWVPAAQLSREPSYENQHHRPFALVTSPTAWLYNDKHTTEEFLELSFNTRLPVMQEFDDEVLVATPSHGMKWLKKADVSIYNAQEDIPEPTGEDIVNTGKKFMSLPYLWAGTSGFGFDCSGFTYSIHAANGIYIPRDSSVQARYGTPVAWEDLQPGDLLFYANKGGTGNVHHVGVYIGDGKMLHSPNSSTHVRIDDIVTSGWISEFAGARRYVK